MERCGDKAEHRRAGFFRVIMALKAGEENEHSHSPEPKKGRQPVLTARRNAASPV